MKERTKSILVALSFIAALLLFIWGFNFLKGKSILRNQYNFYAVYENTKGLLPGDLVTINGMQVGTVSSLKFHPSQDGSIVVAFVMNKDLDVPRNTVVNLASSLTGSVSLELVLGDSPLLAENDDTLTSAYDNGTMGMITETLVPLKNSLQTLLNSLNDLTANLNDLLNQNLKNDINKGVSSFASSMENINAISNDLQYLTDKENGKLTVVVNNLETITNDFSAVSDSLKEIDYTHLVNSLENTIAEFNILLEGINNGEGSVGRLVKEDSLYNNINTTVETLQSLLEEIKANPKKIKLSVF
ncbi:MAG: MCE family protein [Bacteroidales bacterium]|nr:MCE family protein [Bacteroidales bacterium]